MEEQEIRIIQCPSCHFEVSVIFFDIPSPLQIKCNRCHQNMLDITAGSSPKQTLSNTMPREMALGDGQATIAASPVKKAQEAQTKELERHEIEREEISLEKETLDRIGEYRLIRMIGRGAMGEIYLGQQMDGDMTVAIKVLAPKLEEDPSAQQRFLQEAKVHRRLDHPNIIKIYDFGYFTSGDKKPKLYMVMEYVEGESIESILKSRGPISPKHTLKIAIAVTSALEHALEQRIIHRDLKPANILIDMRTRKVKVADLGLGKMLEEKGITLTGEVMGSAYYMPPEQIRDSKLVDHRADIYALGATIYHMISGQPPYSQIKGTLPILKAKMSHSPISLQEHVPSLYPGIAALVEKAMARDREMRYNKPSEMREEMQGLLKFVQR